MRKHVLERLTIFLAEARRKQSEYTVEYLSKEGNFNVVEVRDLKAKYTYRNGRKEYYHSEVNAISSSLSEEWLTRRPYTLVPLGLRIASRLF